jgi:hypothetical protein
MHGLAPATGCMLLMLASSYLLYAYMGDDSRALGIQDLSSFLSFSHCVCVCTPHMALAFRYHSGDLRWGSEVLLLEESPLSQGVDRRVQNQTNTFHFRLACFDLL